MNVYAVALQIERKEAGQYSRTTQTGLRAFVVHAEDDIEARSKAHDYFKNQYPHWYLGGLTVELVSLYGVSTEGASWATEVPAATYQLAALDSEQRVVGTHDVAFSRLDNGLILRLPSDATPADAEHVRRAAQEEFPDRRSIVIIGGDVEFLRVVPVEVPE
jgi:hypothetical protein